MDKNAIINDIKANNGAEIAVLQQKFNLSYKEVKAVIDELVEIGRASCRERVFRAV